MRAMKTLTLATCTLFLAYASIPAQLTRNIHHVNYGNAHPLSPQHSSPPRRSLLQDQKEMYRPIRIHLRLGDLTLKEDEPMPSAEMLQTLINKVIIPAKDFFEATVLTVRSEEGIIIPTCESCYYGLNSTSECANSLVQNVDLAISVRALSRFGSPNARVCMQDQFDRPTVGRVELTTEIFESLDTEDGIAVWKRIMEHEIAHLLGMASNLFLLWYDSMTGLRRSPLPQVDSICGFMPGNSTLRLAEPRVGNLDHWELVTPTVQAIVYNQFNCSGHLLGGRLESRGPYSGSDHNACPGSHWDSRWFHTELMSDGGSVSYRFPSILMFAAFEDSGWYLVNYTNLEPPTWGRGASCDFLMEPCLINGQVPAYGDQFFCSFDNFAGCTNDHERIGICSVRNLTGYDELLPPPEHQYFNSSNVGGRLGAAIDYCPNFQGRSRVTDAVHTLDCTDPLGNMTASAFEIHGNNGKCIESSLPARANFTKDACSNFYGCPAHPMEFTIPLCMDVQCNPELEAIEIRFGDEKAFCEYDGHLINIPDVPGHTVKCPRLAVICKDYFCPKNCIGRGLCDYSRKLPTCTCNDPSDKSPYCANSPRFAAGELQQMLLALMATPLSPSVTPSDIPSLFDSHSPSVVNFVPPSKGPSSTPTAGFSTIQPSTRKEENKSLHPQSTETVAPFVQPTAEPSVAFVIQQGIVTIAIPIIISFW